MDPKIIFFPEFEQLKLEVDKLRTELSMLVLEKDTLSFTECENLKTSYMLQFGALEHKVYKAQCQYLRLRRKIELMQAKINRQESVDMSTIEAALDAEFAEYLEKLNEQIKQMNEALERSKLPFLSESDASELKKTYRRIVKALHPDLHPDNGEEKIQLFHQAVAAYERGDLNALRIIDEMVSDPIVLEYREDALDTLRNERERLLDLVSSITKEIQDIKSRFPFTAKELLFDQQKTQEKKSELERSLQQYKQAIHILNQRIEEMTNG